MHHQYDEAIEITVKGGIPVRRFVAEASLLEKASLLEVEETLPTLIGCLPSLEGMIGRDKLEQIFEGPEENRHLLKQIPDGQLHEYVALLRRIVLILRGEELF